MCLRCNAPEVTKIQPDDYARFFRIVSGRQCNKLNGRYLLPADDEELKVGVEICVSSLPEMTLIGLLLAQRFELFHRMIRFVLGNKNYVGPVKEILSPKRVVGKEKLRVLDLGTGGGLW